MCVRSEQGTRMHRSLSDQRNKSSINGVYVFLHPSYQSRAAAPPRSSCTFVEEHPSFNNRNSHRDASNRSPRINVYEARAGRPYQNQSLTPPDKRMQRPLCRKSDGRGLKCLCELCMNIHVMTLCLRVVTSHRYSHEGMKAGGKKCD